MKTTTLNNDFKFFMPLEIKKSKENGIEKMCLQGLAGDTTTDAQGENLDYSNFDLSRMYYVNWEHSPDPSNVVGVITEKNITKNGRLFIKTELFENNSKSKDIWGLAKNLAQKGFTLGFSVEGKVLERDLLNPKKVLKAEMYGVAICKTPVNSSSYAEIMKSLSSIEADEEEGEEIEKMDTRNLAPVFKESVDRRIKKINEKYLKKSEVYSNIFFNFTKNPVIANGLYDLILKTSKINKMEGITQEQIKKAMEILDIAKAVDLGDKPENGGEIDILKKEMDDAEKALKLKKAAYEKSIAKAAKKADDDDEDEDEDEDDDLNMEKSSLKKSINALHESIEKRTTALGTIFTKDREDTDKKIQTLSNDLKKSFDVIEKLKDFNDTLAQRLNIVENQPIRKSVDSNIGYKERFEKEKGAADNVFSVSSKTDRIRLKEDIHAKYSHDLKKSENREILEAMQEIELTSSCSGRSRALLKSKGYDLVA